MRILITGTTGYIGKRLIPMLLSEQHELVCCVRDVRRIPLEFKDNTQISFLEIDFLKPKKELPKNIDAAYYLIHSMSTSSSDFSKLESDCANNFKSLLEKTMCKQVVYLSGIVNDNSLSKHLKSRYEVEKILQSKTYAVTTFRAGIIVGSGSASFEIIRDLVEKLPVMVTPKWLYTKTQPIAIRDVLTYLTKSLLEERVYDKSFDIYGPEILTYKEMLLQFAEVRKLNRIIFTVPFLSPKLSSYWLYFVTSTSFNLAKSLVDSMTVEVIGSKSNINEIIEVTPITYKQAVKKAFVKIAQNSVISSWKDAKVSGVFRKEYFQYINLPKYGCFIDERIRKVSDENITLKKIWEIGGKRGWYKFTFLWKVRGFIDQVFGGVGLRRGRRDPTELEPGDALDFWRVLLADKDNKRLLLFAEMKLPGEAWLEYFIKDGLLYQKAVFRPKGIWGRVYWFAVLPFHGLIFKQLINFLSK
ncbi:SDR family oxidoreductase [Tenacibaculum mesophilum]|uniref:SDR family oxidoreductase n=1 Tax=Tenacibaculum mesophilum TaxID=104268 RepID=UPI00249381A7|nr:SDR family oxidoreductase [Tenacibaculum mesophilum]